jgi:hypothetical protein
MRVRLYCQNRGVMLVGEIYQLSVRQGATWSALTRFLERNRLPPLARALVADWRPPYADNDAIRKLWDRPVGDMLLKTPQEPYDEHSTLRRVDRWIRAHRHGRHYIGQLLQFAQGGMWYLQDLQLAIRCSRWPIHAAMLVTDWSPPPGVPTEWKQYLEKVGLPKPYAPAAILSRAFAEKPSDEDKRRYDQLAVLFGSVEELDFSVRSSNALKVLEIGTVWELVQFPRTQLLKRWNFGRKSLAEVERLLAPHELSLEMSEHDLVRYVTHALRGRAPRVEQ